MMQCKHNTNPLHYIYSRSAAERIFDCAVKEVEIYQNCLLVKFETGSKFVSKRVFKEHFATHRQEKSREVYVSYHPFSGNFRAPSSHNLQDSYSIELHPDHLECTCQDWAIQAKLGIKTPTCKHCYAALEYMGCTSIKDYIEKHGCSFLDHNTQWEGVSEDLRQQHKEAMLVQNLRSN